MGEIRHLASGIRYPGGWADRLSPFVETTEISNVPGLSYDVGPDGRLLLLRTDGGTERPGHLNVILNWSAELEE